MKINELEILTKSMFISSALTHHHYLRQLYAPANAKNYTVLYTVLPLILCS